SIRKSCTANRSRSKKSSSRPKPSTSNRMSTLVKKEIRLLLPAWLGAAAIAIFSAYSLSEEPVLRDCIVGLGFVLLAVASYGRELGCGTFSFLLSQPMSRRRLWLVKIGVLAAALLSVMALFILFKTHKRVERRTDEIAFFLCAVPAAMAGGVCT